MEARPKKPSTVVNYCLDLIKAQSDRIKYICRVTLNLYTHSLISNFNSLLRKPFIELVCKAYQIYITEGIFASLCFRASDT